MKYIISVAKAYKHRGNHKHKASTKKFWFVYWLEYDEIEEDYNMYSKQISSLLVPYYKRQQVYKRTFYCPDCDTKFQAYVNKRQKEVECPYCLE
jgi:hypothetical protein